MVAKKKNSANKPMAPEAQAEYAAVVSDIMPLISEVIDEKGGFCALSELGQDPRVSEAILSIPAGMPRSVKKVCEQFPDFISFFEGGRVATAKGYENGHVNQDGTINVVPKNKKKQKSKESGATSGISETATISKAGLGKYPEFKEIAVKFGTAALKGTDEELESYYQQMWAMRRKLLADDPTAIPNHSSVSAR